MQIKQSLDERAALFESSCTKCQSVMEINPANIDPRIHQIACPMCGSPCTITNGALVTAKLVRMSRRKNQLARNKSC